MIVVREERRYVKPFFRSKSKRPPDVKEVQYYLGGLPSSEIVSSALA
jgi:hypothetical protein